MTQVAVVVATPTVLATCLVLWGLGVFTELDSTLCSVMAIGWLVVAMGALEVLLPRTDLPRRPPGLLAADLALNVLAGAIALLLPILFYLPLGTRLAIHMGTTSLWDGMSPPLAIIVCLLSVDFVGYWWHRLQHTTGESWMWRLHSVHHGSTHFDFWMGARVHPLDVVGFGLCSYGLVALTGAPRFALEFTAFAAAVVGAVHHTRADTDCGWLNRLVPMADHHLMHHSIERQHNGNFGNITTVFDQLFGTWIDPSKQAPTVGAWSLSSAYPHGDLMFLLLSPFAPWWQRAKAPDQSNMPSPGLCDAVPSPQAARLTASEQLGRT